MASKSMSELVDLVQTRIGSRASGKIGSRAINEAIVDCLNDGILDILQKVMVPAYRRKATVEVTSSTYRYDLPTVDENSATIRVRNISKISGLLSGSTNGFAVNQLQARRRDKFAPVMNVSNSGRPSWYTLYGGKLEFLPWPDGNYTMYLRVDVWPDRFNINQTHDLGQEYDAAIAAFATMDIFSSLQLDGDASLWLRRYDTTLKALKVAVEEEQDWEPSLQPDGFRVGNTYLSDDAFDPFVRN